MRNSKLIVKLATLIGYLLFAGFSAYFTATSLWLNLLNGSDTWRRNFAQYFNKQSLGFVLSAQSYCGGESLVGMLSAVGKQVLWRRIMADETWEAQVFGKNKKGK
ncbi:hypothetical protein V7T21_15885 [Segatella copri]|jgi:hypothetical protein|uniref:hypothetical protein n=1 Tax=Segatella copri TaxID=165179 RepID=UPI002FF06AFD